MADAPGGGARGHVRRGAAARDGPARRRDRGGRRDRRERHGGAHARPRRDGVHRHRGLRERDRHGEHRRRPSSPAAPGSSPCCASSARAPAPSARRSPGRACSSASSAPRSASSSARAWRSRSTRGGGERPHARRPTYDYLNAAIVLPAVAVVITTWLASWVGSRRVLRVRPIQAIGNSHEQDREELGRHRARNVIALVLFVVGVALLVVGVVWGLTEPYGVLVGMVGGIVSFTGIVLGAHVVMPPVLRFVGRVLGQLARRPPRGGERGAPSRAQLADDDRPRHRRDPRHHVRRDDGVVPRDDPRGAARAARGVRRHRRDAERDRRPSSRCSSASAPSSPRSAW